MNKRMREIMATIEDKTAQAKAFMVEGENKDVERAASVMEEVKALRAEFEVERAISEAEADEVPDEGIAKAVKPDMVAEFAKAARAGFRNVTATAQTEGVPKDGGYAVPEDIVARIQQRRDAEFSLRNLVSVEPVKTLTGARTFRKRASMTGFSLVSEAGTIGQMQAMEFERVEYTVKKYAGYMPVTDELLADADASLVSNITDWIGDEARATDNANIIAVIGTPATDLANYDGIKHAINVTLGQAFAPTTHIVTNDDGLNYLDTLKDENKRYLLSPDPVNPMQMRLAVGSRMVPIDVVPNAVMPTPESGNIPFIVGDLKEGIVLFDRQSVNIKMSDSASVTAFNAFEQDMTLFRAILREDVKVKDAAAFVAGYINPSSAAAADSGSGDSSNAGGGSSNAGGDSGN